MIQNYLNWANRVRARLYSLYARSETTMTRVWFGFFSFMMSVYMYFDHIDSEVYHNGIDVHYLMFSIASPTIWAAGFLLHSLSLFYGALTNKYNTLLLLSEAVLGVALWIGMAAAIAIMQHFPGPESIGGVLALWLLIRYPTHSEWEIEKTKEINSEFAKLTDWSPLESNDD